MKLKPRVRVRLAARVADKALWEAARKWAGRRPVFTSTGRLRAGATFCSARNRVFQGLAADGAIYGLWLVWRAGHKIVNFIHDQLVIEAPADYRRGIGGISGPQMSLADFRDARRPDPAPAAAGATPAYQIAHQSHSG
jgi:hypothetical protein